MSHLKTLCGPSVNAVSRLLSIDFQVYWKHFYALSAIEGVVLSVCRSPYFSLEMTSECFAYLQRLCFLWVTRSWSCLTVTVCEHNLPQHFLCWNWEHLNVPISDIVSSSGLSTTALRVKTSPANIHNVYTQQCSQLKIIYICHFIFLKKCWLYGFWRILIHMFIVCFSPKRDNRFNIYYLNFLIVLNCLPWFSFNVFNLFFMPIYYKDPLNCRCEVFRPKSSALIWDSNIIQHLTLTLMMLWQVKHILIIS